MINSQILQLYVKNYFYSSINESTFYGTLYLPLLTNYIGKIKGNNG